MNNNDKTTLKELATERMVNLFHTARNKGLVLPDYQVSEVGDLQIQAHLTKEGLNFSFTIGDTTVNYYRKEISLTFESYDAWDTFTWSNFLDDVESEIRRGKQYVA